MIIIIYKWKLHPDSEKRFLDAWSEMTKLVHIRHGSLGSRLHRGDENEYFAYAQWPSKLDLDKWLNSTNAPDEQAYIDAMEACVNIKYKIEEYLVISDNLYDIRK